RSGFMHLYRYGADGQATALTNGNWMVEDVLGLDETAGTVFFSATKDSPLERHAYAVPLAGGEILRLSNEPGVHDARFSENAAVYVDSWSNTTTPPQIRLHRNDGRVLATLLENDATSPDHPYAPYRTAHRPTEFGQLLADDG